MNVVRIWLLTRDFASRQVRNLLIGVGAVAGALLVVQLLSTAGGTSWNFHEVFFPLCLFGIGAVLTSVSFSDLHMPRRSAAYLTIPASHAEKTAEKLLTTNVAFIIVMYVGYFLYSVLAALLSRILYGESFGLFNPWTLTVWNAVRTYFVVHSIILFGAVYFRRKNLIKTVLVLAVLGIGFSLLAALITYLVFGQTLQSMHITMGPEGYVDGTLRGVPFNALAIRDPDFLQSGAKRIATIARVGAGAVQIFFWYIMAPALWVLTWLRLRETEVAYGV